MQRAVLKLLVGLMLSLGGGASALTFGKDGKQDMPDLIPDNQTPQQLLETVDSKNKLLRIIQGSSHILYHQDYSQKWNRCSLVLYNIHKLLDKCQPSTEVRKTLFRARKGEVLKDFNCGFEGYQRYLQNKGHYRTSYENSVVNCSDERTQFTVEEYVRLEKIIQGSGSAIVDSELNPKPLQPEAELAAPKVQDKQQEQTISPDTEAPLITILSQSSNGPKGTLKGRVTDNTGLAGVTVDGKSIDVESNGNFLATIYVPEGGVSITIEAFDLAGLSSSMSIRIERDLSNSTTALDFDRLNPIAREAATNPNALALIIGLEDYEKTDAKAAYADSDASVFADYAALKLGISQRRIKTLVNEGADISDVLLSVQDWLSRAVKQDQSDVYIFFAGHGLASDDGEKMYLLPYDGSPRLLSRTALLRDELFSDIAAANPRSVTVFLDTCYSGTTRGTDMLIASRPIAIRAKEQAVPEGFTVMTAAAGDQTAKPLEEAKHGMFSYFLMKGMEGDADANKDNQITAGELHAYVQQNVIQQSSGSQTPELQGDADRVLVRFK